MLKHSLLLFPSINIHDSKFLDTLYYNTLVPGQNTDSIYSRSTLFMCQIHTTNSLKCEQCVARVNCEYVMIKRGEREVINFVCVHV